MRFYGPLRAVLTAMAFIGAAVDAQSADPPPVAVPPRQVSGIYPHLAFFNDENECGTGAVVPWADRLWVVTYAPHQPQGSSDKLYEINADLTLTIRPESIGGTPANRMIHLESQQLFIGPYVIDQQRQVRVIPYTTMFGRPTGNARHLFDPANKLYLATMEEGLYEIDVHSLAVTELWRDEQLKDGRHSDLPGYHGKGLYSGQGRLVYANNGEHGEPAKRRPETPSGVLATWDGQAAAWTVVRRNQFTEVTGPGGLEGNAEPATDPIWAIGWDHRSLLLQVLENETWHTFRLPKSSHSYDGAHGWNTEWPRIREIGETDLLMTMHGAFWRFPRDFGVRQSSGIAARSNYLKVVGDFCRWQNQIVLGCDDAARSGFLNQRKLKEGVVSAGQSQSNLRFMNPVELDQLGPVIGRGAAWLNDDTLAGQTSDPFLFEGYDNRALLISHHSEHPVHVRIDLDSGSPLQEFQTIELPPHGHAWVPFPAGQTGSWVRVTTIEGAVGMTAMFQYSNIDHRGIEPHAMTHGLAGVQDQQVTGGLLHARGANMRTLRFVANNTNGTHGGYELDETLTLRPAPDTTADAWVATHVAIPADVMTVDAASVLYVDEQGKRWRLPKGDPAFDTPGPLGLARACREVCTERDLLNVHGTCYELPAENAGGFAKLRPIATHNMRIQDFATYRGLLVLSGVKADAPATNDRIIRSTDGLCALWVGSVDDLWQFGKVRGTGGPWMQSAVAANVPSDPYLMTGYDKKRVELSHTADGPVELIMQVDFTGNGDWIDWQTWTVPGHEQVDYTFPAAFNAYWVRMVSTSATTATARFIYE